MPGTDQIKIFSLIPFVVIGICFFMFSQFIKLINGSSAHTNLFLKIGFISFGLGLLGFLHNLYAKRGIIKKDAFSTEPD